MKNDTKSRLQSANTFKLTGINTSQKSSYNNLEIFEGNLSKNIFDKALNYLSNR